MDADRAAGGLDQSQLAESLHESGDARAGRADDLRKLFMGDVLVEPKVGTVGGSELLGELQQRLGQAPFGIGGDEIEHGYLPLGQSAGEMTKQDLDRARLQQLRQD